MSYFGKYATAKTIVFPIVKRGVVDLAQSADWTPATGDTKISINNGTLANTTNNPAIVAGTNGVLWSLALTTGEMTGLDIRVQIVDSATKAVEDQTLEIYTYGNAAATFVTDFSAANMAANILAVNSVTLGTGAIPELGIAESGTAQSATGTTLVMRSAAVFADSTCIGMTVAAFGSTQGYWQYRTVTANVGSTDTLTVDTWTVTPSGTIAYVLYGSSPASTSLLPTVLLSTGTGTGQLDFTAGVVKANLAQILGTALTETAGLIAAGFKQFFNIASPTSTMNTITTVTTATTTTNLTNAATAGDLTATMKTSVKTQVTDALAVDTYAELGAVPAATSTLKDKITWLFMMARNKRTQTATTQLLRNDADSATIGTSTEADDGTTATRGKFS